MRVVYINRKDFFMDMQVLGVQEGEALLKRQPLINELDYRAELEKRIKELGLVDEVKQSQYRAGWETQIPRIRENYKVTIEKAEPYKEISPTFATVGQQISDREVVTLSKRWNIEKAREHYENTVKGEKFYRQKGEGKETFRWVELREYKNPKIGDLFAQVPGPEFLFKVLERYNPEEEDGGC